VLPSLEEIHDLELKTLRSIARSGVFARLRDLQLGAAASLKGMNPARPGFNLHLGFTLDMRLRSDRKRTEFRRRIDVGAQLVPDSQRKSIESASYSVLICRTSNALGPIVRKFHVDYEALSIRNSGEPKPSVHFQFCGKLSPQHIDAGYTPQRLHALYPNFEKPRIPMAPTCLALMLNWLFMEFQREAVAQALLRDDDWQSLVREAEQIVLAPYFEEGRKALTRCKAAKSSFFQKYYYESA
jgi:hypothetical protein